MNNILAKVIRKFYFVYIADIVVYSQDGNTHLHHLQQIFKIMGEEGLSK